MRVLLISSRFHPHRGGLENVVRNLANELVTRGHVVKIVANRYPRTLKRYAIIDGLPVERLFFIFPEKVHITKGRVDLWLAGLWFRVWTKKHLKRIIRDFNPDVVNSHYLNQAADFTGRCLQEIRPPIPWVISLHGGDVDGEPWQNARKRARFNRLTQQADLLTACSQILVNQAVGLEPAVQGKITVLHNGVDLERFRQAQGSNDHRPFIFSVGQLASHKGFDLLIRAFAQVHPQFPAVMLKIAGSGPEEADLKALTANLNMGKHIDWLGSQPEEAVASLMKSAIFVAMPSRREPFGIVALEAMATGKNLLVTPVGGIPEFVPPGPNLFIQPELSAWVAGLGSFLARWQNGHLPDPQPNLQAAAGLTWHHYAIRMEAIYQNARQ